MLVTFVRTIILYLLVICAIRFMGKRQVGQLQPAELVIAIMISDLASTPMSSNNIPLISGIVPIITLIASELLISWLCLKNHTFRKLLSGKISILIYKGKIMEHELAAQRFNLEDLLEELRQNNICDISQVEYAILETSGHVSVIPKPSASPVTLSDLNIKPSKKILPCTIISDGVLNKNELRRSGKTQSWLEEKIKQGGVNKISDVFIGVITCDGEFFMQRKGNKK